MHYACDVVQFIAFQNPIGSLRTRHRSIAHALLVTGSVLSKRNYKTKRNRTRPLQLLWVILETNGNTTTRNFGILCMPVTSRYLIGARDLPRSRCNNNCSKPTVVAAIDVLDEDWSNGMMDQESQICSEPEIVKQGSRVSCI